MKISEVEHPIEGPLGELFVVVRPTERWSERPVGWSYTIRLRQNDRNLMRVMHLRKTVRSAWTRDVSLLDLYQFPRDPAALRKFLGHLLAVEALIPYPPKDREAGR